MMLDSASIGDYNLCFAINYGTTSEVFFAQHNLAPVPVAIKVIHTSHNSNSQQSKVENQTEICPNANTQCVENVRNEKIICSQLPENSYSINDQQLNLVNNHDKNEVNHSYPAIDPDQLKNEVEFMQLLNHPNICKLFEVIEEKDKIAFVMEFAENGSLASFLAPNRPLNLTQVKNYFYQLVAAVDYLHNTVGIAHRDIKAENVLLDSNFHIKLCDFGLSHKIIRNEKQTVQLCDWSNDMNDQQNYNNSASVKNQSSTNLMTTQCGSPYYVSPEIILNQIYDEKTDVWSLGVLLYLMATGTFPFYDEGNNVPKILHKIVNDPVVYPPFLEPDLVDLLEKMLNKDPLSRISIDQVKLHKFVSKPFPTKSISLPMLNNNQFTEPLEQAFFQLENYGINLEDAEVKLKSGSKQYKTIIEILAKRIEEKQRRQNTERKKRIPSMGRSMQISRTGGPTSVPGSGSLFQQRRGDIPAGIIKKCNIPFKRVFVP
ncbi:CAMK family protein kinase [Tritrichomonas foetus]|uniref:non-specific serine/threonine protein kinase n=1 Tax=Tritrichomonas foetus TaxID=1144522 RepID=A0A1J4JTK9_9EUKA|nr:CAMK family protein kinase [Tritrichomonas foetus]|eukprot:OHT00854.1 CAMK family protein kinase [Tritrichomonas foetus]